MRDLRRGPQQRFFNDNDIGRSIYRIKRKEKEGRREFSPRLISHLPLSPSGPKMNRSHEAVDRQHPGGTGRSGTMALGTDNYRARSVMVENGTLLIHPTLLYLIGCTGRFEKREASER